MSKRDGVTPIDVEDLKAKPRIPGYRIGLTSKEEAFCRLYVASGGKVVESSKAAGFHPQRGSTLMTKGYIKRRIQALQQEAAQRNDIDVNWVVTKYKEVVEKGIDTGDLRAANGALEGLGKYLGMFQKEQATTEVKIMGFFTHDDKGDVIRLARAAGFQLEERANPPREAVVIEGKIGSGPEEEAS